MAAHPRQGQKGHRRDGPGAHRALRPPPSGHRLRLPRRRRVAERFRVPLRVRRDGRPAHRHRRDQEGHGKGLAHGPSALRRRGRRQNGGRLPCSLQVCHGRQAVRHSGPHHPAGVAALQQHHLPHGGIPGESRAALPLPHRQTAERDPAGPAGRQRGHRHRHPPPPLQGRPVPRPGPCHHRRGAAFRCQAQGEAERELHRRGHADPLGHPHPPHPEHGHERHPRPLHHRAAAHRAPAGGDIRVGIQ